MSNGTAVFFDFENYVLCSDMDAFVRYFDTEFKEKVEEATSSIAFMKAYADWSMPRFRAHAQFAIDNGIEPVQVFGYSFNQDSKNIADFMITLDIYETAMTKPYIENFVIVTGDAGFSVIINRLRALGKRVVLYKPNENCSRYLERLADVCLCMDMGTAKKIGFAPPVSDKAFVLEQPFTPAMLPEEDKIGIRLMQPENLRKFEEYGITPTRENVKETIIAILRVLTCWSVYENNPFTVISVSRLSALIDAFIINFNYRSQGHKTITKYLNGVLNDSNYRLARRNKESLYYVVVSESGLKEAHPNMTIKYEKDFLMPKERSGRKDDDALAAEKPKQTTGSSKEHAAHAQQAKPLPLEVNIAVPLSNRTIIIARPFDVSSLPQVDKQNARIMQPSYLKNLEVYGLIKYGPLSQEAFADFLKGTLKILTSLNLYPQHPQIVTSISLLTLLIENFVDGFSVKKYGHTMMNKLVEATIAGTEYSLIRKDSVSQYYIVVTEKGLREVHPDVTVITPKQRVTPPPAPVEPKPQEPPQASELEKAPGVTAPTTGEETQEFAPGVSAPAGKKIRVNDFYVRHMLSERLKKGTITDEGLNNLADPSYCADLFKTPLPLLREVTLPLEKGRELDENGKKVYWKRVFRHNGRHFLIYGEWKDAAQKERLISWIEGGA